MKITKKKTRFGLRLIILICLPILTGGCYHHLKEPFEKFQKNTEMTASIISSYYAELNRYERKIYFRNLLFNPAEDMNLTYTSWNPTSIPSGPFDPDSIRARLDLIREIASYSQQLSALAGSDAPERFETEAKTLADKLEQLSKKFEKLSKKPEQTDKAAYGYVGPLSSLAAIFGKEYIAKHRIKNLKQIICDAEEPMKDILGFLKKDLKTYIEKNREQKENLWLAELASSYNSIPDRPKETLEQRKKILDEIDRQIDIVEATALFKPSRTVSKMRVAHQMLVKWAKGKVTLYNDTLWAALANYETEVENLNSAFLKLKDLRKDNK